MNNELLLTGNLQLGLRRNDIKHLTESCNKLGIKTRVVTSDKFYQEKGFPRAIVNITGNPNGSHLRYLRAAELAGTNILNPVYDVVKACDKGLVHLELDSMKFNVPKTLDLPIMQLDPYIFDFIEQELGFPCVIKVPNLGYGIGVFLVKNKLEFEDFHMFIWACVARSGDYMSNVNLIAQEYLPNSDSRLLKVYILDGKVIGCYYQFYESQSFLETNQLNWKSSWRFIDNPKTPTADSEPKHMLWNREKRPPPGLLIKQIKIESDLEAECLSIFDHFNLKFGSIDLLPSMNKYYYIDINPSPGLGLCYMVGQDEPIGDRVVKYLMKDIL